MRLTKEEKEYLYWTVQNAIEELEDERDDDLDEENQKRLKKLHGIVKKIEKDLQL